MTEITMEGYDECGQRFGKAVFEIHNTYRGWNIDYHSTRPATGLWQAERYGVTLSAHSFDAVKKLVDQRIKTYLPYGD